MPRVRARVWIFASSELKLTTALPAQHPKSRFLYKSIWTYKSKPWIKRQAGDHAWAFISVVFIICVYIHITFYNVQLLQSVLVTVIAEQIRTHVNKSLVASLESRELFFRGRKLRHVLICWRSRKRLAVETVTEHSLYLTSSSKKITVSGL